jgi:hypothetical protein
VKREIAELEALLAGATQVIQKTTFFSFVFLDSSIYLFVDFSIDFTFKEKKRNA